MSPFTAELFGTMLLVLLGDGVVANVVLQRTKGQGSGWIVITTGWGLAVALAVYSVGTISGGHLNPAVTIALAAIGQFKGSVPMYILAQMIGAFLGAILVWLAYLPHWSVSQDPAAKLAVFCTGPAVRRPPLNLITEIIATFVLVFGVLAIPSVQNLKPELGFSTGLGPLLVGALVWGIGLSLGGPTGHALNPARDLAPRLAHMILPIPGKGTSDFPYAWVPVLGPIIGGLLGAVTYKWLWSVQVG
jgi:glycerol uptake facilitator protein